VKDFFLQLYDGVLRFSSLRKHLKFKTSHEGNFPKVGFLSLELKQNLENILGIKINREEIFEQALMHRSYLQVLGDSKFLSNERLEFFGDSVLGMVIAEYLFSLHTNTLEGDLTKMRSWLVNQNSLALCARKFHLDKFIMMSHSAAKSIEQGSNSILCDCLEAIIAAIYIDSGLESARKFILDSLLPILMSKRVMVDKNYKSILLETVQAHGKPSPKYIVLEEEGPDHDKEFKIGVYVEDVLLASGLGKSKKLAEQDAAHNALENEEIYINNTQIID
jgi:ribonuclease III